MMLDEDANFFVSMKLSDLEIAALERARELLRHSRSLFCDSVFTLRQGQDPVVDRCLDPARACGDHFINQASITVSFDTNYLARMEAVLKRKKGELLNEDEHRVMATISLAIFCDAMMTPGFALAEMLAETSESRAHMSSSYRAFQYLCIDCPKEDVFETVLTGRVADWQLALPNDVSIPISQVEEITRNARFNAELFACLCAGIVERKCADTRCNDEKLELFFSLIKERGALAPGSMRYFALYFSDQPAKLNVPRRSLLKGVRSSSLTKVIAGIRNAASDCYFASEYSSSLNTFHERQNHRIFATEDRALQHLLAQDAQDRDGGCSDFADSLRSLRGGMLPNNTKQLLEDLVSYVPVEEANPSAIPPLRASARKFLENPVPEISAAWEELLSLV